MTDTQTTPTTGADLVALRAARRVSQVAIANRLRHHRVTISNWERGVTELTPQMVRLYRAAVEAEAREKAKREAQAVSAILTEPLS